MRTTQQARRTSYVHARTHTRTHTETHTWLNQLNTRDECVPSSPDRILKFDYRAIPPLGDTTQFPLTRKRGGSSAQSQGGNYISNSTQVHFLKHAVYLDSRRVWLTCSRLKRPIYVFFFQYLLADWPKIHHLSLNRAAKQHLLTAEVDSGAHMQVG